MSTFPPMTPCVVCGNRWTANVLDNFGVCPICWADADAYEPGEPAEPVTFIGPEDTPCYCRRCLIHDDPAGCLVRYPS